MEKSPKKKVVVKKAAAKKAAPRKRATKSVETKVFKTDYKLDYNKKEGEVDLHFSLKNPVEDRFFAYSLTLMDLHQTLESVKKVAPPEVVRDFITALKVLTGLNEAVKLNIEFEAGLISKEEMKEIKKGPEESLGSDSKERIKKMLNTIREKLEKQHPGVKVVIGKVDSPGKGSDSLADALEKMRSEMENGEEEETKSDDKLERFKREESKPSKDLEL